MEILYIQYWPDHKEHLTHKFNTANPLIVKSWTSSITFLALTKEI